MFSKKRSVMAQVRDFHCGVCGIDYFDQYQFERHVSRAHTRTETPKTEREEDLAGSENKA